MISFDYLPNWPAVQTCPAENLYLTYKVYYAANELVILQIPGCYVGILERQSRQDVL